MPDTLGNMYQTRKLADGYPGLERLAFKEYTRRVEERKDHRPALERLMTYLNRLVDLETNRNVVVVGCGPKPQTIAILRDLGYQARGVEPVPSFVESARQYLGSVDAVVAGAAEAMPLPDDSQHLVILESVLEHVDSPVRSLSEVYRVLAPGGLAYVTTTNWPRFTLVGRNGEFNVPFFNWFPGIVQECYVFQHLHYRPHLANYTERPAVHWYSYNVLCKLGRQAGFAQFYALVDLVREEDPTIARAWLRRFMVSRLRSHPWVRALVLTQVGGSIIMLKRRCDRHPSA